MNKDLNIHFANFLGYCFWFPGKKDQNEATEISEVLL